MQNFSAVPCCAQNGTEIEVRFYSTDGLRKYHRDVGPRSRKAAPLLTPPQQAALDRAARDTHRDMSGQGAEIMDGRELATFKRLEAKGYIKIGLPCCGAAWGHAKATAAGYQLARTAR